MAAEGVEGAEGVAKQTGKVKWFNSSKGFGFITPDVEGDDLFVHQSSIYAEGFRSLREGEEVEFLIETSENGRTKAHEVTGPGGSVVQGAPRRDTNYGGGRGGGYGLSRGGGRGVGRGGGREVFGGGDRVCYNCQEPGHIARMCPNQPTGGVGGEGGGARGGVCYQCQMPGHFARDCPSAPQ